MRKIAFINEKGGTCKTTLSVNVAAYFAQQKGLKVLLVDLDTQGHAGKSLGVDVRNLRPNVFHYLSDEKVSFADVVQTTSLENLSLVPSNKDLSEFPVAVAADPARNTRLARRLNAPEVQSYDVVIFDAPPSMGLTTVNILAAASEVVVPVALTYLSMDGCAEMVETVRQVSEEQNRPELTVSLVVPTLYRKTALADEILAKLKQHFPDKLARMPLGYNVKIDEAQSHGRTIWEHAPWSRGAEMLQKIAEEILQRGTRKARKVA